ncbi:unnamed protein product, partial [marine sediment metagenome]
MSYKIINGYYSQDNSVHLIVRNDKGKFIKTIKHHMPYIYIKKSDYDNPIIKRKLDDWKENNIIKKVIQDTNPEFKKIYLTNPKQVYEVRPWLETHNVTPFEADIPYVRRILIDNLINIGTKKLRKLFIDIETDDSRHGIEVGRDRILTIGLEDENNKKWFLKATTEIELLKKFGDTIKDYDVLIAWYGKRFDFPYIETRCRVNNVWIDWRHYQRIDFYIIYRKSRQQDLSGGYNLDNVGKNELGTRKIV